MHEHFNLPAHASGDRLHYVTDPNTGTERWVQSAGGAQTKWLANLQASQKPIVAKAIQQQNILVQNFTNAVNSGRWAQALTDVGDAGIKAAAQAKAGNYSTGIQAGQAKYLQAAQGLYPYIGQGQSQIASMPSGTLADSKARASFWIDYMAAAKGRF